MSEIKLRAITQIAKITKELEKAEGFKGNQHEVLLTGEEKQTKEQQIHAAGLGRFDGDQIRTTCRPN
jgi:hypothetical protein